METIFGQTLLTSQPNSGITKELIKKKVVDKIKVASHQISMQLVYL
jgi:hypothetical protein